MVPSLNTLKNNGIEIEGDPSDITPLPPYAENLRRLLLNFREIVPFNRKADLEPLYERDKHLLNNKFPLQQTIYCDSGHRTYQARWEAALNLRDKAMHLLARERETSWNGLMTNFVFEDVSYQASDRGILLTDLLSWGSDELFTNAVDIRGQFPDTKDYSPKPDFWFGLGLYDSKQSSRLRGLELEDKGIEYFTQKNLEDISTTRTETLIYQPVNSRRDAAFPWMVVELKHEDGSEKECMRQVANASHTSLMIYERLAEPAAIEALPIVAFTSVGPHVKIFIAYKSKDDDENEKHRISCIWSGNIENILHAVQLRRIIDQLIYWVLRHFKPWVTECLEHWYREETEDEAEEEIDDEADDETDDEADDEIEGETDGET